MNVGRPRKHNKHLPRGVTLERGVYYFRGRKRKRINLGRDFASAMTRWAELVGGSSDVQTMADLFERYEREVMPKKAEKTQYDNAHQMAKLKPVFGKMRPGSIKPRHLYAFLDKRSKQALTSANREYELLSHCLTKAVQWGVIDENPCRHVRRDEYKPRPRNRYVTDEEFDAVYELATERMQIAMNLAVLTGLRQGDILSLTRDSVTDDGLVVSTKKTRKVLLIAWSPELETVVERAKKLRPRVRRHLLCTRDGKRYSASGFKANWQRLMGKAVKRGVERFTFHDLRAKSASDDSLEAASERLGHANSETTKRVYRRKPETVQPLR